MSDLGKGAGLKSQSLHTYQCIASPALTAIHQELSTGLGTIALVLYHFSM